MTDEELLAQMDATQIAYLEWQTRWLKTARDNQLPPEDGWTECGFMAGRGFGKTRVGAEWIGRDAFEDPLALPGYVIAPTQADVRFTCFEGESGLLSVIPSECVKDYNRSDLILTLTNGAILRGFSAEKPDRLRGPQAARAWCFSPDTVVTMADGSLKAIRHVLVGEMVLTRWGPRRVTATGASGNPSPQVIVQAVSDVDGDAITLHCTSDHPLLVNEVWRAAGDAKPGDRLQVVEYVGGAACGAWQDTDSTRWAKATVTAVRPRPEGWGRFEPHCITVEGANEFVANGVLVHNCDELAAWQNAETTWDMMAFGLRLGPSPKVLWTTTPKPVPLVRSLIKPKDNRVIITGSTYDNKKNLPKAFFDNIAAYEGTKIGRQELDGELLDPEEAGIIKRSWFNLWSKDKPLPRLDFIVLSLDTAYTEATRDKKTGDPDPTACTVWGVFYIKRTAHLILLDAWDEHLGLPDLIRRTKREMNTAYGDDEDNALIKPLVGLKKPITSGRKPDVLLIEDKGSGISLRQMLAEARLEAYAYNPGRADKLSRLHVVSPIFAQRRVWVPESDRKPGQPRTWAEPMIAQLCSFTGEGSIKHDDFVDSVSQAFRLCMDKGFVKLVKEAKSVSVPQDARPNPYAS